MAPPPPRDPLDAALQIAETFEARGISYALGGALAYGLWAVPRATVDIDVNVFVKDDALDAVFRALTDVGASLVAPEARAQNAREGMFVARWDLFRIDVFTPSIEFAWEAERTRVRRVVGGRAAWFLSAEVIAVFKLLFFRTKDIADLERLVALRTELDVRWVRGRVAEMLGEADERVLAWDRLVAQLRRAP